ncbi:MAG TPA: hypothetical protein VIY72_11990 [Acidimicrobiales bacterium]
MRKMPRVMSITSIVVGVVAVIIGVGVYLMVHFELADQKITVSQDAPFLAGDEVDGPFSAYAEAMAINDHAKEAGGGRTYAEIPQDDPTRETVMTADFLQASLFTSVVAFGVAALVIALGVVMVLFGFTFMELDRRTRKGNLPAAPVEFVTPESN